MRASELGKVSRNKRQRATTSDDTIAADRDERNRRRSQREAPKPRVTNTSDATREAMATFRLDATRRPRRRTRQERRESVVSITTKLISRRQLSSQGRQLPRRLYVETDRRPFLDHHPQRLISDYLAGKFRRPHHNHLTSINAEIDRRDDGSVPIAPRILCNQRAKIRWGLLIP
jgi:hypothetical protein